MERGITLVDFVNVDSMVQVHGNSSALLVHLCKLPHVRINRLRGCWPRKSQCQFEGGGWSSFEDLPRLLP